MTTGGLGEAGAPALKRGAPRPRGGPRQAASPPLPDRTPARWEGASLPSGGFCFLFLLLGFSHRDGGARDCCRFSVYRLSRPGVCLEAWRTHRERENCFRPLNCALQRAREAVRVGRSLERWASRSLLLRFGLGSGESDRHTVRWLERSFLRVRGQDAPDTVPSPMLCVPRGTSGSPVTNAAS